MSDEKSSVTPKIHKEDDVREQLIADNIISPYDDIKEEYEKDILTTYLKSDSNNGAN